MENVYLLVGPTGKNAADPRGWRLFRPVDMKINNSVHCHSEIMIVGGPGEWLLLANTRPKWGPHFGRVSERVSE